MLGCKFKERGREMEPNDLKGQVVWLLYMNYLKKPGKIAGVFSSAEAAKAYTEQQPDLKCTWKVIEGDELDYFISSHPDHAEFYLSIEPTVIDSQLLELLEPNA
jgi:hypothetical protein